MTSPDLEQLYKQHSSESHVAALEVIFKEGIRHAINSVKSREDELQRERDELQEKYDIFTSKSVTGLSKQTPVTELIGQALDMGQVFKK